ncbi:unnamed protein product [Blepharisma stoltei]|uniref:Kelch motif family protein n=1 Tax=Blepharisma stoltei TaxID=1481888 RepID=A0AAU9JQU9_9CILI|nr:unnamed protein product [Blepharisma stoltei]
MECWKLGCKNKVKVLCKCVVPALYSCKTHWYKHSQAASIKKHDFEHLQLKPNQGYKEALIEELHRLSRELLDIKENLIKETYKKIQELKLSLIKELENIEKIRINQLDLIRKIDSVKTIPKINQNPLEKLLSLDPDSARKKLDELGCRFNRSDFESNEIVFFRTKTKNSVRVNLTNFSKSEQQIDILQTEVSSAQHISMCLLPDKSIFCYGDRRSSGIAFRLYPDNTIKQLSNGDPSRSMGAVYHDGFIYLFGGYNAYNVNDDDYYINDPLNQAAKYELSTDNWYKICPLKENLSWVSCIAGNYGIAFVGYQNKKLYSYNHKQDIYNEIYLNFQANTYKVLLQAENRVFLIESSRNIYESEPNKLSNWKTIGQSQIFCSNRAAYQVYFNQSCYFMDNKYKIYKFDMKSLQLTMTEVKFQ